MPRCSSSAAFLRPALSRSNLTVVTRAQASRVIVENGRAVGVEYLKRGSRQVLRAEREVILAGGAVNSPQLLQLSGIGDGDHLRRVGVKVVHELKGVGENLRDHYSPRMKWTVPASLGMTYNDRARGLGMVKQALQYAATRKGLLGLPASPIRAYVRTRPGLDAPDAAISWIPFLSDPNFRLAKQSGITAIMNILRSESTGSIHVTSKSARTPPC